MAKTLSTMVPLGTPAPDFKLPDTVSGRLVSWDECKSEKATVIMFICNHCPYVKHINSEITAIAKTYQPLGVSFAAVSANNVETHPEDAPELMKECAKELGYTFPYLYDETQQTARAYRAACTPDFFVFDGKGELAYRGQLDDSRPGSGVELSGRDLRSALDALLAGQSPDPDQKPSIGCNIKWKE